MSYGERNLAAEARGVEAGHRARLQPDGTLAVSSDTHHGKAYRVTAEARPGGPIRFSCQPAIGRRLYTDDHLLVLSTPPGVAPCMHAAVAARRLEREHLATLDLGSGLWLAPGTVAAPSQPADPWEGLPR